MPNRILVNRRSLRPDRAAGEKPEKLPHHALLRADVFWSNRMRIARLLKDSVILSRAESLEHRSRAVGAKGASKELANNGDRAALVEDERRQKCWLVDPAPNANAGERHDRGGQFLWQDDRPFALVIA